MDQVRSLEEHLEAIYGLVPPTQPGGYRRRLSHPGHTFPVSPVDCASSRDSLLENGARGSGQREHQESTRAIMKAFAGSCITWCREKYGKVPQMISNGISIMVSSYHSSSRLRTRQSPTLFQHFTIIVEEGLSFAGGVISTSLKLIRPLYRLFKGPLMAVIAFWLVTIVLLNSFAAVYSFCAGNVLDTFCPKKLPVLRNWICDSWDALQDSRELTVPAKSTISPVYLHYLESEDSTISYKLPHYLSLWEQAIRSFRASLPESEYSIDEQERFHALFTTYIQESIRTTKDAHLFYAHITGTVNHHVSDTRWLVQKLQDHGLSDNITLYVNGPLAQSMQFFNDHKMVYLPLGLQPFQQNVKQHSTLTALDLMKAHVGAIMQRLSDDIMMINVLQQSLHDLALSSDEIRYQASRLYAENRKASVVLTPSWWDFLSNSLQYRLDKYTIDRQRAWLQDLRPVVQDFAGRLRIMATEFEHTALLCRDLRERLYLEGRAARYGWEASDWIAEQARELTDGFTDLQSGLQNFKEEKIRFDEHIFRRGSG